MTAFPKTRAAAGYAARHGPGELARARATLLLARLDACEDFLPDGDVPAARRGLLRDLVLAARDLAGPAWLAATGGDPDMACDEDWYRILSHSTRSGRSPAVGGRLVVR